MFDYPNCSLEDVMDAKCYCCFRTYKSSDLKHRASSLSAMTLPYCEHCLDAGADPTWMIDSILAETDGHITRGAQDVASKVVYYAERYMTVAEYVNVGGYIAFGDQNDLP